MDWNNVWESIISGVVAGVLLSLTLWGWKCLDRIARRKEREADREKQRIEREIEFDRERILRYRDFIVCNPYHTHKHASKYLMQKHARNERPYKYDVLRLELPVTDIVQQDSSQ